MSALRASLTKNGQLQTRHFTTRTLPRVTPGTRIVAAAHATSSIAGPGADDWFVSDYFAFNYLLRGQGQSQTWLIPAKPETLLRNHGNYLHGNPFRDRKTVLSPELLQSGELTETTFVPPSKIIDTFLAHAKVATEEAKRDRGAVLFLIFCHGDDDFSLLLDTGESTKLTISRLQGVLEPYVPVCLITTACYSGGWTLSRDLNITTMTAATSKEMSLSWPRSTSVGRACGSLFVGSIIPAVGKAARNFPDDDNQPLSAMPFNTDSDAVPSPSPEKPQQVLTYNSLCRSVWDFCKDQDRLWTEHHFSFGAQSDEREEPWSRMTGIAPDDFEDRWEKLVTVPYTGSAETRNNLDRSPDNPSFAGSSTWAAATGGRRRRPSHDRAYDAFVGPFLESLYGNNVKAMVQLWRTTCPGDDSRGRGARFDHFLAQCMETGKATPVTVDDLEEDEEPIPEIRYDVVEILKYRWNMAALAESILDSLDVCYPANQSCLMWDRRLWAKDCCIKYTVNGDQLEQKLDVVHEQFRTATDTRPALFQMLRPAKEQGPTFRRFTEYLAAGITEELCKVPAGITENQEACRDRASILTTAALERVHEATLFHQQMAFNDPDIRRRGREWAAAMRQ